MAIALMLSGCPLFQSPQLNVTPKALTFGDSAGQQFINIANLGSGSLAWTLEEVTRASEDAPWTPQNLAYLSADATSGATTSELDRVVLSVNRAGLPVGTYNNVGVRVNSNGGSEVVPLAFIVAPTLIASPESFALLSTATSAEFTVSNTGSAPANWQVLFLPDPDNLNSATTLPEDFRVLPNPASTEPGASTVVAVEWGAGRDDFFLLLQSNAGSTVLSFRFGAQLEGLQVTPSPLRLFKSGNEVPEGETQADQPISKLSINNNSPVTRTWSVAVRAVNGSSTLPISVAPATGSTAAGQSSKVDVSVRDITQAPAGAGNFELIVSSGDGFLVVPIIIEIRELPIITLSEPPDAETSRPEIIETDVLDFGRDAIQAEFWVANTGPRNSRLYFKIEHDDIGAAKPLLIDIQPIQADAAQGDNDFFFPPGTDEFIDGTPINVTIDRTAMTEDVEYREIRIIAYDEDFTAPIEAVEIATIQVRVERKPLTIEGALNRARPPFIEKFVFLLRDTLTQAIPTRTPDERQRVSFTIQENGTLIDLNETNSFVTGPENLRVNLVLMLDYTGSMYNAGTTNPENPLVKGEALAQVNAAALRFLDDLPPSYRVALMYHNDRQQQNRLIKNFTTDREALKSALTNFTQPPALFGVTSVRDALIDAMDRLANEDSGDTLPFDDADVRAVVFVSDGRDNASIATASDVESRADETLSRLYPVVYSAGGPFDAADFISFAENSGGHLYSAGNVTNLAAFLGNAKGLTFDPVATVTENKATFKITNGSTTNFSWTATKPANANWITDIAPSSGPLAPGASINVVVTVNPALIGANNLRSATINIATNNNSGAGTVEVQAAVGADPSVATSVELGLTDEPGTIWNDLRNQIVLTYLTPSQTGGTYLINARYAQPEGGTIAGSYENDGLFYPGDVRAGQISLYSDGITEDLTAADPADQVRAEVYVRCDYAPRNVTRFRLRFMYDIPTDGPVPAGAIAALRQAEISVELAPRGLLVGSPPFSDAWRLFSEPDNSYVLLTDEDNYLSYGAEGNLLKITITNLRAYRDLLEADGVTPRFNVSMRADNQIYVDPAGETQASDTKFFLYPGASTHPDRVLVVGPARDVAGPARDIATLQVPNINPEAEFAWDFDIDLLPDFNDPFPFDFDLPGLIVVPNPVTITSTQTVVDFDVRNQRLDTFAWSIDPSSIPPWATLNVASAISPLPPGQITGFTLTVDRTGLPEGLELETLRLLTDRFGSEDIPMTLVVPAP